MDTSTVWIGEGPLKGDIRQLYLPDADAKSKDETVSKAVLKVVEAAIKFFTLHNVQVELAV